MVLLRSTLTMLPHQSCMGSRRKVLVPNLIEKGLIIPSWKVATGDEQTPEWKLRQQKCSLSRSAQAICRYYKKLVRVSGAGTASSHTRLLRDTCFHWIKGLEGGGPRGILNKLGGGLRWGDSGVDGACGEKMLCLP